MTPLAPVVRNARRRPATPEVSVSLRKPRPERRIPPWIGRAFRSVLGVTMVLGLGGGAAWGARRYVTTTPRFEIHEIVTTGARHRSPEELAALASLSKGQNIFTTDLDRARRRLLADPWIREATLSRQLPGTVFVRVVEHEPSGIVATTDGTYLVTRVGAIIKRLEAGDPTDLPIVTGLPVSMLLDDRDSAAREIRRALDLASDYEHSPLARRSPLEEVHLEETGDLTLVVGKSGLGLRMGAPPYRRKLEQAVRVVAELDRRSAKADLVMLDNEARSDRVVVRMR